MISYIRLPTLKRPCNRVGRAAPQCHASAHLTGKGNRDKKSNDFLILAIDDGRVL